MIKVEVEDYCQSCLDFEPNVTRPAKFYDGVNEIVEIGDTIIRCEWRKRCAHIVRHIKR